MQNDYKRIAKVYESIDNGPFVNVTRDGTAYFKDRAMTILHREDGPAVVDQNGNKQWWQNDMLHRFDGPAVEYTDGRKEYWIEGENVPEEEFEKAVSNIEGESPLEKSGYNIFKVV